ncbi:MAG: response regulator [Chloroflexota bacterium]
MRERYALIVDNDEGIRDLATATLQDAGIEAVSVADAVAALQLIVQHQPGIILLDTMGSPMTDAEFITAYRNQPGPHAPVILLSAWDQPEQRAAEIGANGVLVKPFDLDAFVAQIRSWLGEP